LQEKDCGWIISVNSTVPVSTDKPRGKGPLRKLIIDFLISVGAKDELEKGGLFQKKGGSVERY
jgi:hypothetical protein